MENLDTYHEAIQEDWDAVNHGAWAESFREDSYNEFYEHMRDINKSDTNAANLYDATAKAISSISKVLNESGLIDDYVDSKDIAGRIKSAVKDYLHSKKINSAA